jgi:hypothetical protein
MERWYKYAVVFVGIALSCVIGTVTVLGYFKSTVKEAVTEALEPIKKRIEILENKQPDISTLQTNLALLTYRINAIDRPREPSFNEYRNKRDEQKDFQ